MIYDTAHNTHSNAKVRIEMFGGDFIRLQAQVGPRVYCARGFIPVMNTILGILVFPEKSGIRRMYKTIKF